MKREEINDLFCCGNLTAVVYLPKNAGLQFAEGFFEDVIPDDGDTTYKVISPDDLPGAVKAYFEENLRGNKFFDFVTSGDYNVIYFVDNDETENFVLIYDF